MVALHHVMGSLVELGRHAAQTEDQMAVSSLAMQSQLAAEQAAVQMEAGRTEASRDMAQATISLAAGVTSALGGGMFSAHRPASGAGEPLNQAANSFGSAAQSLRQQITLPSGERDAAASILADYQQMLDRMMQQTTANAEDAHRQAQDLASTLASMYERGAAALSFHQA
jgi:hypothetical protein